MFIDSLLRAPITKKANKQQIQHLFLNAVDSKTSYQVSLINYQIFSASLRQTGKKASIDWTSLATCLCPPEMVPSYQVEKRPLSPSVQLKEEPIFGSKRKFIQLPGWEEWGTSNRNPVNALLATQHIHLQKSWEEERRKQEETDY